MKEWFGLGLILASIIVGLYLGVWLLLIGGLVQFISNLHPFDTVNIAWGFVKVIMSGAVGWGSFAILFIPGFALLK
jgi:hypothetical protein